jgi:Mrp family chromosome partitioning ATPase
MISPYPDKAIAGGSPSPTDRKAPAGAMGTPHAALDHYHALWGRLNGLGGGDQPPRSIGVTSCARGAGVSTVAANLARAAAESLAAQQVLLVDAHARAPTLHRAWGAALSPGLSDVLAGRREWRDAVVATQDSGISLLAAGGNGARVTSAADLNRCAELLADWQAKFDVVLLDLPPVGDAGPTLPLAGMLDGVLLVIEAERISWEAAERAKGMLTQSHARLLGAVLNERSDSRRGWIRRQTDRT